MSRTTRHARQIVWEEDGELLRPGDHAIRYYSGTYTGTCVMCMRPTDTGLALWGKPWQCVSGLIKLRLSVNQALRTVAARGFHGNGEHAMPVRVCTTCADAVGMRAALLTDGYPIYSMPVQDPCLMELLDWVAENPERDVSHPRRTRPR